MQTINDLIESFRKLINQAKFDIEGCPYVSPLGQKELLEHLKDVELALVHTEDFVDRGLRHIRILKRAEKTLKIDPDGFEVDANIRRAIDFIFDNYEHFKPTITSLLSTKLDSANDTKNITKKIRLKTELIDHLINILKAEKL